MILIVGHKGSMGTRYARILDYLGKSWCGIDIDTPDDAANDIASSCDGIIIATPTALHYRHLLKYVATNKPVFCEKPFTKNLTEMKNICEVYDGKSITMAYQYSELVRGGNFGDSGYNYYKHGNDGLVWDCIQIIGLANSIVTLSESSPIWTCKINGQIISIADMDMAYVKNIKRWLSGESMGAQKIYDIHQKVVEFGLEKSWKK